MMIPSLSFPDPSLVSLLSLKLLTSELTACCAGICLTLILISGCCSSHFLIVGDHHMRFFSADDSDP